MKAIVITHPGPPGALVLAAVPRPSPGPGEVLIKVAAAGINRPDVMQRLGLYPPPPGASEIPGLEIAGTIVTVGDNVDDLEEGDDVCALVTGGGYAEYCVASAPVCLPIPKGFDMVNSAALPETFFTVWSNVIQVGKLKAGESFVVHGGSSGIGTTAIQLAKANGATVIATAGSNDKCDFCQELGATAAINYRREDFVERIDTLTDGKGVNLILDIVGGDYLQRNLSCLAPDGRLIQIALQGGPKTTINLLPIMLKRLTLTGSTLRPRSVEFKAQIAKDLLQKVWPLIESGSVKPVIDSTFALADACAGHRLMESNQHIGKIVLTV